MKLASRRWDLHVAGFSALNCSKKCFGPFVEPNSEHNMDSMSPFKDKCGGFKFMLVIVYFFVSSFVVSSVLAGSFGRKLKLS